MRATAWREDGKLRQTIKIRDHTVEADEPKDHGGEDAAPSPQELLAASLASCTSARTTGPRSGAVRNTASAITPRVPSEPMNRSIRSISGAQ